MISKGDLLISDLSLAEDLVFRRSVVLICDLDEDKNPMGFILNKPLEINLSNIFSEVKKKFKIYFGGPVSRDTLFCIHKTNLKLKYSKQITKDLSYGFDLDEIITKTENGELNKNNLMIFLGYSGWNNHQLYNELNEKCWKIKIIQKIFLQNQRIIYGKNLQKKSKVNLIFGVMHQKTYEIIEIENLKKLYSPQNLF